ncbi:MAG: aspartate--tRNA ligase [Clostridia bacterium]|nr:aspartate--tRNA ligase [Clostridia bacterium]
MEMRTHNCGELRAEHEGQTVKLSGWLDTVRDMGSVIFFVLRDFYGITQAVASTEDMMTKIREIPRESTISITGKVALRSSPNKNIPTGLIEILPEEIEVLGKCYEALPFEVAKSTESREETRLKYRFLDLRNPAVKDKIVLRSKIVSALRQKMTARGFLEITTPILTCSSPEGARDYIVPSRNHPGKFYALPQAPQQFKQLLMTSGFDKYFQIAPCFRDEDARADRSPGEFYQLDMEMAFATQEDVFAELEAVIPEIFEEFSNKKADKAPFERIPYLTALEKYGSDKPDLRNPLIIQDVTDVMKACELDDFKTAECVKAIVVNKFDKARKYIDSVVEFAKEQGAKTMFWFKVGEGNTVSGGVSKFVDPIKESVINALSLANGDFVALLAGNRKEIRKIAGSIRTKLGNDLDLLEKDVFRFCWIVDFPMYEIGEESGELEFCHNPFSMPQGGLEALNTMDPLDILAYQYDIVCNGIELSSGAVRNHNPEIMLKAFELVGMGAEDVEAKFPALYNAFKYGAPPHAGVAPGVDRMIMLLLEEPNIREVIAFPMNKNAMDLMMNAPSEVTEKQLKDVHIAINLPKEKKTEE